MIYSKYQACDSEIMRRIADTSNLWYNPSTSRRRKPQFEFMINLTLEPCSHARNGNLQSRDQAASPRKSQHTTVVATLYLTLITCHAILQHVDHGVLSNVLVVDAVYWSLLDIISSRSLQWIKMDPYLA